jgi:hypothetical protein
MSPPTTTTTTTTIEIWTRSLRLLFLKELSTLLSLSLPKQGKVAKKNWVKRRRRRRRRKELTLGRGGRRGEGEVDEDGDLDQIRVEKVVHKGVHPTASYGCPWGKKKVDQLRQEESWPSIIKLLPLHSPPPPNPGYVFPNPPRFIHPSIHPSIHSFIHQLIDSFFFYPSLSVSPPPLSRTSHNFFCNS